MTASFLSSTEKRNGIKKHTIANDVEKQKLLTQKKNGWGWGVGWTMEAFSPPVSNDVPKFVIPSYASLFSVAFFFEPPKKLDSAQSQQKRCSDSRSTKVERTCLCKTGGN